MRRSDDEQGGSIPKHFEDVQTPNMIIETKSKKLRVAMRPITSYTFKTEIPNWAEGEKAEIVASLRGIQESPNQTNVDVHEKKRGKERSLY